MAKAKIKTANTEKVVLTLSKKEADVLNYILRNVGGQPTGTRGVADKVLDALRTVDIDDADYPMARGPGMSGIYFTDM